ncbi:RNA-directed RNA polymerase [ssRNA phage SRR6960799_23]|uniref:RNA-directed RNA polymerase n=1 Tax=ssRNA phage SRR6960799_23 TaxID=2786580 RepID=A0A8S5L3Q3_9VIRU|nr:RNA-directed RNA polymerase [ssRNA phage SRR6960799_23]DAD52320.1 TPA_asm: RNA-directed RNA polymerase [ssRNA phage SRR6960799_23]
MGFLTPEVMEVGLSLMEGLSCARSLSVAILMRHNEWDQLVELQVEPANYVNADDFWRANVATSLFSKCRGLPVSYTPERLERDAIALFFENEKQCHRTNIRLEPLFWGRASADYPEPLFDFFERVKKRIRFVVGRCPSPDLISGRFGPGATMSDSSRCCTAPDKLSSVPTLTQSFNSDILSLWDETAWARALGKIGRAVVSVIRGNSFFTVPKKSTARRACAKEPSLNVFYQLGLSAFLRRRLLRRAGIDLQHGQDAHKLVACKSSLDERFATIDLSSASDTVCKSLVKLLLPEDWYRALNQLRSHATLVKGRWYHLEKFSSMGNGFTFELETLIFWALSAEACRSPWGFDSDSGVMVYGDDIIVPTPYAADVLAVLAFCGFTPNKRKTYIQGPFRESCGGDFYRGVSVRAHYLEEIPYEPQHWIALANGLRRMVGDNSASAGRWDRLRRAWFRILDNVPEAIRRCRGPQELGDLVICDEESRWQTRWRSSRRWIKCYRPVPQTRVRWEGFAYEIQLSAALYLAEQIPRVSSGDRGGERSVRTVLFPLVRNEARDINGDLVPRDPVLGFKVGWTLFS